MPRVQFKAKVQTVYNMDNTVAYQYIKVPALTRSHCNMHDFRTDAKYGSYANSDLFTAILDRAAKAVLTRNIIRLDSIPPGVSVDTSGFLANVSFAI